MKKFITLVLMAIFGLLFAGLLVKGMLVLLGISVPYLGVVAGLYGLKVIKNYLFVDFNAIYEANSVPKPKK